MKKGLTFLITMLIIGLVGCSNNNPSETMGDIFQNHEDIKLVNYGNELFLNNEKDIQNLKELIDGVQVKEISRKEFKKIFHSRGDFREKQESLGLFLHNKENKEEPPLIIIEITSDGSLTPNELDEEGRITKDYLIIKKDKKLYQDVKAFLEKCK